MSIHAVETKSRSGGREEETLILPEVELYFYGCPVHSCYTVRATHTSTADAMKTRRHL